MNLIVLFLWQTKLKEASTATTSFPMKPDSAAANVPMLTAAKNGVTHPKRNV